MGEWETWFRNVCPFCIRCEQQVPSGLDIQSGHSERAGKNSQNNRATGSGVASVITKNLARSASYERTCIQTIVNTKA